ncbi:hypothetical protein EI94DRAFT_1811384 [Lactarius quietus]|nr:hypothetical protein EI94DRAFT_1811384 [Lactarius quietus]
MLFNKSIISFVAAIALATSVAAGVNPPSIPNPTQNPSNGGRSQKFNARDVVPSCSTGIPTCCGSTVKFSALTPKQQDELHSLDANVTKGLDVGLICFTADAQQCGTDQPLCCDSIQNTADLQSVAANCFSP